jgi:L-aspartate oxidase
VARDRRGLVRLRQLLDQARPARGRLDLATVEATNLHGVSALVAAAALARPESRGCHRWRDAPAASAAGRARHTVVRADAGQPWSRGSVQAGVGASA